MWQSSLTAPFDHDLELAVIDAAGQVHALVFPCRRAPHGWVNSATGARVHVFPTHWREWAGALEDAAIGEPEADRLAVVGEYADDLRAIIKNDRDGPD
jgi:hypothetical protein